MKCVILLALAAGLLQAGEAGAATPCGKGGVTVMAFGAEAGPSGSAGAGSTTLVLKIDRPQRPDLPGDLTLYPVSCRALAPLLSTLQTRSSAKVMGVYRKLGPEAHAKAPPQAGPDTHTFDLIVLSNPTTGHEADYNRWYDTQHIPEVLQVPGFETAQRFKLVSNQTPAAYPLPRYAIRFVFHSGDLQATADDIKHRLDTGVTHRSPYFDMATSVSRYYAR